MKKFFRSGAVLILCILMLNFPFERFISADFSVRAAKNIIEKSIVFLGFDYGDTKASNEKDTSKDPENNIFRFFIDRQIPTISLIDEEDEIEVPSDNTNIKNNYYNKNPIVLIYHTHATECYTDKYGVAQKSYRTKDVSKNVVAVGDVVANVLYNDYGIEVYHDLTLNDSPSYDDSYNNSEANVRAIMKKYPSIKYVFDIHRDGVGASESAVAKYQVSINGKKSSKIMIVVGMDHKNSAQNKAFSEKIKKTGDNKYPNLFLTTTIRPQYRFNQFLCLNGLLFEVGSNQITLEEAKVAGAYLGNVIGIYIKENKK